MRHWRETFGSLAVAALVALTPIAAFSAVQTPPAPASLVADSVSVDPVGKITAEGRVEVFYQGRRLTADKVVYTRNGNTLQITGPITITDQNGTVILASSAELDSTLKNGVMMSARLVLDRQLQLAANEIARVGDRYLRLDRVVASSCRVCANSPIPLWEIRADQVIHDEVDHQLYFSGAQVRIVGLPVLYLPRLRIPDPTVTRATGVLIPSVATSTNLGVGVKLPYFVALGDYADVTLTPYLSVRTKTLQFGYRQNMRQGALTLDGALTNDDLVGSRGYVFANAAYRLPDDFIARLQLQLVSDSSYLYQYNFSGLDRLTNQLELTQVKRDSLFRAGLTEFKSLRASEIAISNTLPERFAEATLERDIPRLSFGGRFEVRIDIAAVNRPSHQDILGRDVSHLGGGLSWRGQTIFGPGVVAAFSAGARADLYNVAEDSTYPAHTLRVIEGLGAELRWPLARGSASGTRDVIEPILRIDQSNVRHGDVPNEDSRVVELDEGNLFAPTRYPGTDRVETGLRIAGGLSWSRENPNGWQSGLAVGRIVAPGGTLGYAGEPALSGSRSDWLLAARFSKDDTSWAAFRLLVSDGLDISQGETHVGWKIGRADLTTGYFYSPAQPVEGLTSSIAEWSLDGSLRLTDAWTASADWRYDFAKGHAARSGLGLGYRNECIAVDLSVSRRYANSTSLSPTTEFGVRVSLAGIGGSPGNVARGTTCRG